MMGIIDYFRGSKKNSASIAKDRLQIIVAHQRKAHSSEPDIIPELQRKIIHLISSTLNVSEDEFTVDLARDDDRAILELNVTLPESVKS